MPLRPTLRPLIALAMAIVWSYLHKRNVAGSDLSTNFLIVAPNVIVYQRLEKDFGSNRIFRELPLVPPEWEPWSPKVILREESSEPDSSGNIFLTNIHQLYESRGGAWTPANAIEALLGRAPAANQAAYERSMLERLQGLKDLVVLNDTTALFSGNPLVGLVPGGAIIMQSTYTDPHDVWQRIPKHHKDTIRERKLRVYYADMVQIAREVASVADLQMRMQGIVLLGAFLKLTPYGRQSGMTDTETEGTGVTINHKLVHIEKIVREYGMVTLGWRDVPVDSKFAGPTPRMTEPRSEPADRPMERLEATVRGRVQGVGYRYFVG
jgi:hypothetical protein